MKKKINKYLSILLTIALVFSISSVSFASKMIRWPDDPGCGIPITDITFDIEHIPNKLLKNLGYNIIDTKRYKGPIVQVSDNKDYIGIGPFKNSSLLLVYGKTGKRVLEFECFDTVLNQRVILKKTIDIYDIALVKDINAKAKTLKKGEDYKLKLKWDRRQDTKNKRFLIKWWSSNENVATVDQNGKVKAVGKGIAYVKCWPNRITPLKANLVCKITVK